MRVQRGHGGAQAPQSGATVSWILVGLPTSVWAVGRHNGSPERACYKATARSPAYREHMEYLAAQPLLARSYERLGRLRGPLPKARCVRRSNGPPNGRAGVPATVRCRRLGGAPA
jgi:hypothetical protein